jgi:hypothetical protein
MISHRIIAYFSALPSLNQIHSALRDGLSVLIVHGPSLESGAPGKAEVLQRGILITWQRVATGYLGLQDKTVIMSLVLFIFIFYFLNWVSNLTQAEFPLSRRNICPHLICMVID